jgi:hypothetical protein
MRKKKKMHSLISIDLGILETLNFCKAETHEGSIFGEIRIEEDRNF